MMMRGCLWGAEAASGSVFPTQHEQQRASGTCISPPECCIFSPSLTDVAAVCVVQSDLEAVGAYSGGVREVLLSDFQVFLRFFFFFFVRTK